MSDLLTYSQAAEKMNVNPRKIQRAVANKELAVIKLGYRTKRISIAALEEWKRSKTLRALA